MKKTSVLDLLDNIPKNLHKIEIRYWKQDEWDDRLEKAIAFGLIASHRLEQLDPPLSFGGESLPYVIRLNKYLGWTWLTTWSEHGLMMAYGVYWLMDGWFGAIPADKWLIGRWDNQASKQCTQSLKDWGTMPYKSARTLESIKVICISPRTCDDLC